MHRQENMPEILRRIRGPFETSDNNGHKLTKLLVNVTIEQSLGPFHVLMSPDNTAEDLIKSALDVHVKEKRRPLLTEKDPQYFQIHYSQFSLESLNPKEKLINLGSRSFFLCSKRTNPINSSCSDQANKRAANRSMFPWTGLMDFLL
ncbi:hypothetical protein NE237_030942 [Protea cynaroides]|uniref:DUF7054 domain-containing protein n=1 Tax=Protea cynaroides TaxID=273540 RepID=A0A9Q0JXF4_9MAGN|nr:hypothetical protein NE237_030942 [Protea cynaroides]